jgi:phosphoglycerate dehydrogenase-like enzyme
MPDILVLNEAAHGDPPEKYAAALREALPDHEVAFAATPHEARALIETAPVVTGLTIDEDLLDAAGDLEWFACIAAGTDHLPLDALTKRDVVVTNASGVHGPNIAEHVIGAFLAFKRRFHEAWGRQSREEWRHFRGTDLHGDTVTIVGLGTVGQAINARLEGFGVDTIGVRFTPSKGGPTDEVVGFDDRDLHEALVRTDALACCCPLTDETAGLIGETELEILPSDAVLVNVGRGGVVDTDALTDAIQNNKLAGAALDVTDPEPLPRGHPLWACENVMITPHVSGYTPAYYERMADIVAEIATTVDETGSYEDVRNRVV